MIEYPLRLEDALHQKLKIKAVKEKRTMREIIILAIKKEIRAK
jgi:hypothetical protein